MILHKEFYYIRHGETEWNKRGIFQGTVDTPLNDTGLAQAEAASKILKDYPIRTICCSPLLRTRQTASFTSEALGLEPVYYEDLREVRVGALEGTPRGENYDRWMRGETVVEGAETWGEFSARAVKGVTQALEHTGPVLIVAHGAFYRAFEQYLGRPDFVKLANCQPLRLTPPSVEFPQWQIVKLG